MRDNLVSLPSGTVLNIERVAFVAPLPDAAKRRRKIRVVFGSTPSGGLPVGMQLGGDDSKALIEALGQLGVDVAALRRATIGRK
jgi:hypothetical protein